MAYRVELTERAARNLRRIYQRLDADNSDQARTWFNGLERRILSLNEYPARGAVTPENQRLRQLLYGMNPHTYRIIYAIDEPSQTVIVLHIRHGARTSFGPQKAPP